MQQGEPCDIARAGTGQRSHRGSAQNGPTVGGKTYCRAEQRALRGTNGVSEEDEDAAEIAVAGASYKHFLNLYNRVYEQICL